MNRPEDATRAPTERPSPRETGRRRVARGLAFASLFPTGALVLSALLAACNLDNPGISAPVGTLSYPVAVALSPEPTPRFLYVANSNFDLLYSTGNVQSYDLGNLEKQLVAQGCRRLGIRELGLDGGVVVVDDNTAGAAASADAGVPLDGGASAPGTIALPPDYAATSAYGNARGVLCDGRDNPAWKVEDAGTDAGTLPPGAMALRPSIRCCFDEGNQLEAIRKDEQKIDSFASGIGVAPDGNRLYVPISSRAAVVWVDVLNDGTNDGKLACGGETGRCRRGPNPDSQDDDPVEKFPGQPASVTVGRLGDLGVTAGGVPDPATFIATAHEQGGFALFVDRGEPILESALTGLPGRPTSVVLSRAEKLLYVATAGDINYLSRLGVRFNPKGTEGEAGPRELLYRTSQVTMTGFAEPRDIRDLAFDPRHPERLYALVRGLQESVAFLELDPSTAPNARLVDAVRIGAGPSKLEYVEIDGRPFLLVSCYDARAVFVIDADRRALVSVVRNLAGPFEMTYDAARKLLYVADFRASVVRVIDLRGVTDKREPPPRIIATLGLPRFQGGLK